MVFLEHTTILFIFFILISYLMFIYRSQKQQTMLPTNWPVLGMIPGFLVNSHRIHDCITKGLILTGGTFMWKGPWFANMDILITTDPLNIQHVLSKNFNNYPKGDTFRKIFDVFGNGIITSDGESWEIHRKVIMYLLKHAKHQSFYETLIWNKVEKGLLPILESISEQGVEMDLQDIFERFTFDTTCKLLFDHDPESLSVDFPHVPCLYAFSDGEKAIFYRHVIPPRLWKLQQILRVGHEKKLSDAWKSIDDFIYKCLAQKQKDYNHMNCEDQEKDFQLLPALMREMQDQYGNSENLTILLRDTLFSLMAAGKGTISSALSWFFYNLGKNPIVEDKILEELHTHLEAKVGERWNAKELGGLTYLHGALFESLRLFPPIPVNHKSPLRPDILPSGHKVDQNTKVILYFYSMGRMKSIWGDDCKQFKPERWISKGGGIKHEPSYKFTTFNSGPRACVGKEMSLSLSKIVIATIIYHYHIEMVEGHPVLPANSVVLEMKHGLKVRLTKRSNMN